LARCDSLEFKLPLRGIDFAVDDGKREAGEKEEERHETAALEINVAASIRTKAMKNNYPY
jgi:hypothetical protein